MKLIPKLLQNFDLLPKELKQKIEICKTTGNIRKQKCKLFHGEECEEVENPFVSVKKCPDGYSRSEFNVCTKDCSALHQKLINSEQSLHKNEFYFIEQECHTQKSRILNLYKQFDTLSQCEKEFLHCRKKKDHFYQECNLNEQRIAFVCVPVC